MVSYPPTPPGVSCGTVCARWALQWPPGGWICRAVVVRRLGCCRWLPPSRLSLCLNTTEDTPTLCLNTIGGGTPKAPPCSDHGVGLQVRRLAAFALIRPRQDDPRVGGKYHEYTWGRGEYGGNGGGPYHQDHRHTVRAHACTAGPRWNSTTSAITAGEHPAKLSHRAARNSRSRSS